MTVLSYKGYQGSVEYEDEQIVVQLLHIDDFVTTTCDNAKAVQISFRSLVDEYLDTCSQTGKDPNKPYKGSLNIRMPADLHRSVAKAATEAAMSLNAWIIDACQAKLATRILAEGAVARSKEATTFPALPSIPVDMAPSTALSHQTRTSAQIINFNTMQQARTG